MFYVYVLKSTKDEELYVGSTNDLKRRIKEHQNGESFSTNLRRPFELIYYEAYKKEKDARLREHSLKFRGNARRFLKERLSESLK